MNSLHVLLLSISLPSFEPNLARLGLSTDRPENLSQMGRDFGVRKIP